MEPVTPNSRAKTLSLDLGAFAIGLMATWALGWSTRDLLWGLWISSLVSGTVFFLRGTLKNARVESAVELILGGITVLFGLGFFLAHFGFFHFIQGSILDLLIPLEPDPGRVYVGKLTWKGVRDFSFFHSIGVAIWRYWALILATVLHQFFSPAPNLKSENESFKPYYFVLKLHFVMFFLAGFYAFGLESFPVYALVLLFFFTPGSQKMMLKKEEAVGG